MGTGSRSVSDPLARDHRWALAGPWPRFLIDHNHPWVFGQTFRNIGYRTVASLELQLEGENDLEVIKFCGDKGLVWVTEDTDARRRGEYTALVHSLEVSAVFLRPPPARGWSSKMKFEVLAKNMRGLEDAFEKSAPRYFSCAERGPAREIASFGAGLSRRATRPQR